MKKLMITVVAACALAFAATAAAGLVPSVYDPGNTGCVTSTYSHGVLHLAKNCPTATNAAALAHVTGVAGQTFQSASFTLANAGQCQGGSPRFNVWVGSTVYFLGCNNVTPTINADGTATYTFTPAALTAASMPVPTGSISSVDVIVDVQGTADISQVTFNGVAQKLTSARAYALSQCKNGGWKTFTSPKFKNQGQCVSYVVHQLNHAKQALNPHRTHHR
ncbi:MAG TPA: hypothetical protein VI408_03005 [Gaiellaceae bacterium]